MIHEIALRLRPATLKASGNTLLGLSGAATAAESKRMGMDSHHRAVRASMTLRPQSCSASIMPLRLWVPSPPAGEGRIQEQPWQGQNLRRTLLAATRIGRVNLALPNDVQCYSAAP